MFYGPLQAACEFSPDIELADGAALGFGVMDFFDAHSKVLVLDALLTEAPPGTIYRLATEQLLALEPGMRPTAHEVDPIQLLRTASALGEAPQMVLLGIVPGDASQLAVGLSPELQAAFPRFIDATLAELTAFGVQARQTRRLSLDDVIHGLVTRNDRAGRAK